MIALWLGAGVLTRGGSSPRPSLPSIGFVMWGGAIPSWEAKRQRVLKEIEAQSKVGRTALATTPTKGSQEATTPSPLTFQPDWNRLGRLLVSYGEVLRPSMTAFEDFFEARTKKQADDAVAQLQIQLEDEIIVQFIAANA